jgi:CRP/FNR family transcriptional regulator, cyclic AMP receptor protein
MEISFDESVQRALAGSVFSAFPPTEIDRLFAKGVRFDIPAGTTIYRETEAPVTAALVISGLVRIYMESPEGRQLTIRYARTGDALGVVALAGGPPPVNVQVLTDTTLLVLRASSVEAIAKSDAGAAWALAEELAQILLDVMQSLAGTTFGSVRQRVAAHLLNLAAENQDGKTLMAAVSQQELADAVGSVREVVARTLRELRVNRLIETSPAGITLVDAVGLHAETWQGAS